MMRTGTHANAAQPKHQPSSTLGPEIQQELAAAVAGVERRAYTAGWWYGLLCGAVAGGSATGLAVALVNVAMAAWRCPNC